MPKTIFISCGQYTDAEKRLGKQISEMVRTLTDCVPFFAEEVQDLNGLDANILSAPMTALGSSPSCTREAKLDAPTVPLCVHRFGLSRK
jgi:hypothetical protein